MQKKRTYAWSDSNIPSWQAPIIDEIAAYPGWQVFLHPTFSSSFCKEQTVEAEDRCFSILYKYFDKINRVAFGSRYKRKRIPGISTAFSLEFGERKGWHAHLLVGGLPSDFKLQLLYRFWCPLKGAGRESKATPIIRATEDEVLHLGRMRTYDLLGREHYWLKLIEDNQQQHIRGMARYMTELCNEFQHRIFISQKSS